MPLFSTQPQIAPTNKTDSNMQRSYLLSMVDRVNPLEEEKKSEPSAETPAEETSSVSVDEGEAVDATKVDAIEEKKDADVAW